MSPSAAVSVGEPLEYARTAIEHALAGALAAGDRHAVMKLAKALAALD